MAKSKKIDKDMGFRLKKARLDQKLTYDEPKTVGLSFRMYKRSDNHHSCTGRSLSSYI